VTGTVKEERPDGVRVLELVAQQEDRAIIRNVEAELAGGS
jgi:hypothetical protein